MGESLNIPADSVLVVPCCRVRGGRASHADVVRDEKDGSGRETETRVVVQIDDEKERDRATAIANKGANAVRSRCQYTEIGYLARAGQIPAIRAALAEIAEEAREFNAGARTCQVQLDAIPLPISVALGPDAVRAIAGGIVEELTALRDTLRAGDDRGAKNAILRTKNLASLAVGPQSDAIRFAREEAEACLAALRVRLKQGASGAAAGATLSLDMVESAIGMFQFSDASAQGGSPSVAA